MIADVYRTPRGPLVAAGAMDLHSRDMTATFAADVTLESAQAELAKLGQWIPIDGDAKAALGDLVSFNSTGPLRLGYGAWRDLLLGVQFTTGRGELISAGGRTVKNVAGYDLTKFIVGSAGVFGKIVSVTTRTYRRPHGALLARYPADVAIVGRFMPTGLRPQWAMLTSDSLLCGYLGDERTIAYYHGALPQSEPLEVIERSLEDDIADRARRWQSQGPLAFRASIPPARLAQFATKLSGIAWAADAAFGVVVGANIEEDADSAIRQIAINLGGSVRFIRRGETMRSPSVDFSTNPIERQIIDRLKRAFDPDNTLNPLPWQTH